MEIPAERIYAMPFTSGTDANADGGVGTSGTGRGLVGNSNSQAGVVGVSQSFVGVWGESESPGAAGQPGVFGKSPHWQGVHGESTDQAGVAGFSQNFVGVWGESQGAQSGVFGLSQGWDGVHGESKSNLHAGVSGVNTNGGPGVYASSSGFDGVHGESQSSLHAGVSGINTGGGFGVWASGKIAGHFEGNVEVTGDILLTGADCAEQFDAAGADMCEPGTVMVLDGTGALLPSGQEYDRRVAGVVSGAGKFRPALVLDNQPDRASRVTIALVGKVYCKAVATERPIEVGDLLTTSPVEGHAMKATDQMRAFGAIIGKALQPLPSGTGLIPVLIALQ
jgi:hypothetical protein